ncbi:hypothetical protein BDZ91DRAFT_750590 [Kalaharituber pfeilii]|nr:hypothetical protein BDZ91DRAFT_750590 [Kalaharituber pfeilii]
MCPTPPPEPAHSEIPNAPTSPPFIANSDFDSLSTLTAHTRAICATETPKSSCTKTPDEVPENAGDTRVRTRREASGSAAPPHPKHCLTKTRDKRPENQRDMVRCSHSRSSVSPHCREQDSNGTQAGKMERAWQ